MVKYFTYAKDSWIAYDDEETYAMKEAFANNRCLSDLMICTCAVQEEGLEQNELIASL
jgi:chitinase